MSEAEGVQHVHNEKTYYVGEANKPGVIVCSDCHPEELKGINECFCLCHTPENQRWFCNKCKRFHISAMESR